MASSSQTLTTLINVNATSKGIGKIANEFIQLGASIDGISNKLIDFGKESINVYRGYEESMADAEVALATSYGQGSQQLKTVMDQLDSAATEWAASSKFHTDDVSSAIAEAAHAGWNMDQIMTGLPASMKLAQAGGMDLSEAVNYLVKSTNAAGIEFEDMESFIDTWVYSANSSASTVQEFGDAMLRMGSTMRFTDSTDELMTLIATTANSGSVGAEAGTLIRNATLRLIAPTKKAKEAMEELGATSEEVTEILDDEALATANAELAAHGFSAFDEDGQMRSVIDIYEDLYAALADISGGYDNISKNQEAMEILSAIFPTRTITEALTLIRGAHDNFNGLMQDLESGKAVGYADYASKTMMDTLDGRIETFESKVERLQQVVGGLLSGDLTSGMEAIGGFVDDLATMDEGKLGALVGALEVVAGAGPGLLAAGGALRFLSWALTPLGTSAVAAIGLTSLAVALERLERVDLEGTFGEMQLDEGAVREWLNGLDGAFGPATEKIEQYQEAIDKSVDSFKTASAQLSSELLKNVLTDAKIEPEDVQGLANQMFDALETALDSNYNRKDELIRFFLGEGSESGSLMLGSLDTVYRETYNEARTVKAEMDKALSDAMSKSSEDGANISEAEYEKIMEHMREYNRVMAKAAAEVADEEAEVSYQAMLHKAQTASLDEIETISDQINSQMEARISEMTEGYETLRAQAVVDHNKGMMSDEDFNQTVKDLDDSYASRKGETAAQYAETLMALWNTQIGASSNSAGYDYLRELAQGMVAGTITPDEASKLYNGNASKLGYNKKQLGDSLSEQYIALGGANNLNALYDHYMNSGNVEQAMNVALTTAMQGIANNWATPNKVSQTGVAGFINKFLANDREANYSFDGSTLSSFDHMAGTNYRSQQVAIDNGMNGVVQGDGSVGSVISPRVKLQGVEEAQSQISGLSDTRVNSTVDGNTAPLRSAIRAEDGQHITTVVDYAAGDTSGLHVAGGGGKAFAEGGRATEASIFGEAGAEWAIPEQHTQRTASLLDSARKASGFTWGELIARNGGLGAGARASTTTVVYSPTINAGNASGVEKVLQDDKRRLEKFFADRNMLDEVEVYA